MVYLIGLFVQGYRAMLLSSHALDITLTYGSSRNGFFLAESSIAGLHGRFIDSWNFECIDAKIFRLSQPRAFMHFQICGSTHYPMVLLRLF